MRTAIFLLLITMLHAPSAMAQTFDEALAAAVATNPSMEDARLGVRSARLERMQARAGYLPSLGISARYGTQDVETRASGPAGTRVEEDRYSPTAAGLELRQDLYTGGRRSGRMRMAHAGLEGAQYALRAAEQQTLLAAAEAYLTLTARQRIALVRADQVAGLTLEAAGTQRRLDVGEVSRTDLLQVRTRLAGAEAAQARALADLEIANAQFEQIIGAPPTRLSPAPVAPAAPASVEEAVIRARAEHPLVREAATQAARARGEIAVERSALLPQLAVTGNLDRFEDDEYTHHRREETSAAVRLSMPLFEGGFAWARTRQSRVEAARAESRLALAQREAAAGAAAAWSDAQAARTMHAAARTQVTTSAEALAGAERERGLGMRSTLDVLNAEQEWRDAQVSLLLAEARDIFSGYALLAAIGALTPEVLHGEAS